MVFLHFACQKFCTLLVTFLHFACQATAVEILGGDNSRYFEKGTLNQYIYDVLESVWVRRQLLKL
jgi:hypothetical protein